MNDEEAEIRAWVEMYSRSTGQMFTYLRTALRLLDEARVERDDYRDDYFRRHKDACDRWMRIKELEGQLERIRSVVTNDEPPL